MNPWLVILLLALGVVACVMIFYMILSYIVLKVARNHGEKIFKKYTDELEQLLPGKNCGKCGCANCRAYAEQLVRGGEDDFTLCAVGGDDLPDQLKACIAELEELVKPAETPENPDARENEIV